MDTVIEITNNENEKETLDFSDFSNFHDETCAIFTSCETPSRRPDFISESGSEYWDNGDSVIRRANHWGKDIASCRWELDDRLVGSRQRVCVKRIAQMSTGYCPYSEFHTNAYWFFETRRPILDAYYLACSN